MADTTPQAVQAAHELLLWIIPQIDKFPRVRRFTLGERLESALLEVLEATLEAAFTPRKQAALDRANLRQCLAERLCPGLCRGPPGLGRLCAGRARLDRPCRPRGHLGFACAHFF